MIQAGQAGGRKDAMRPKLHAYSPGDFTHMLAGVGDLMLITAILVGAPATVETGSPASSSDGYPQIHTIQSSKGYDI
jgi:hypothetical protein